MKLRNKIQPFSVSAYPTLAPIKNMFCGWMASIFQAIIPHLINRPHNFAQFPPRPRHLGLRSSAKSHPASKT